MTEVYNFVVVYSIEACSRAQGIGDTGKRGCTVQFHICVDEKKII